ncbi:hypothetical protein [Marinobacter mobilis]|uniref:hypothetical protein n=1 Tax=Marinobacter mobilis TaxID=488533 RepID=UPI0035C6D1FC
MATKFCFFAFLLFYNPLYASPIEFSWDGYLNWLESGVEKEVFEASHSLFFDEPSNSVVGLKIESPTFHFVSDEVFNPSFEILSNGDTYWFLTSFEVEAVDILTGLIWTIGFYDFNIFLPEQYGTLDGSPIKYMDKGNVSIYMSVFDGLGTEFSGFTGEDISKKFTVNETNSFFAFVSGLIVVLIFRKRSRFKFN